MNPDLEAPRLLGRASVIIHYLTADNPTDFDKKAGRDWLTDYAAYVEALDAKAAVHDLEDDELDSIATQPLTDQQTKRLLAMLRDTNGEPIW